MRQMPAPESRFPMLITQRRFLPADTGRDERPGSMEYASCLTIIMQHGMVVEKMKKFLDPMDKLEYTNSRK